MSDDQARRAMAESLRIGDTVARRMDLLPTTVTVRHITNELELLASRHRVMGGDWFKLETKGGE